METNFKGYRVSVNGDKEIFVDGKNTGLVQWDDNRNYSKGGTKQSDISGKGLIEALQIRGLLPK